MMTGLFTTCNSNLYSLAQISWVQQNYKLPPDVLVHAKTQSVDWNTSCDIIPPTALLFSVPTIRKFGKHEIGKHRRNREGRKATSNVNLQ